MDADATTHTRHHSTGGIASYATYSLCENYRYALTRSWGTGVRIVFVMLNPSTASEIRNDPTVERCERRARALSGGAFRVVNLFAFRATDPRDLKAAPHPIGAGNNTALRQAVDWGDLILCAWGVHGAHLDRGRTVEALLRAQPKPLHHLGLTKDGHPRHPLYLSYAITPQPWPPRP